VLTTDAERDLCSTCRGKLAARGFLRVSARSPWAWNDRPALTGRERTEAVYSVRGAARRMPTAAPARPVTTTTAWHRRISRNR